MNIGKMLPWFPRGSFQILRRQLLESEHRGSHHMTQSVEEQIRILPSIETEAHLFEVCGEVLGRNFVPRSDNATLEQGECGFHGVRVHIADNVLFGMADG